MRSLMTVMVLTLLCAAPVHGRAVYTQTFAPAASLTEFNQAAGTNGVFENIINVPDNILSTQGSITLTSLVHSWSGDLVIQLQKVGGPTATLVHRVGSIDGTFGSPNAYNGNYTFSSVAGSNLWIESLDLEQNPPADIPSGMYLTSGAVTGATPFGQWGANNSSLTAFNGLNSAGQWKVIITDMSSPNTGTLGGWSRNIVPGPSGLVAMMMCGLFVARRRR